MSELAGRAPAVAFAPDRRLVAVALAGAVVTVVTALTLDDAAGRLMFWVATALLACHAAASLVFTPRLRADAAGLRIRTPSARVDLAWDDIEKVGADVRTRLGLRSATLQVVATATVAAFASGGGLGQLLTSGQAQSDYPQMFAGAILIAALAIVLDLLLGLAGWGAARRARPRSRTAAAAAVAPA